MKKRNFINKKMRMITEWQNKLKEAASPEKAKILMRFFKTAPGEYGEGDIFIGVTVPVVRSTALPYSNLPLTEISKMLKSEIHEFRLSALLALVQRYKKSKLVWEQVEIVNFYLQHTQWINNWDLVDLSAPKILGAHIAKHPECSVILYELAESGHLWSERIAMVSNWSIMRHGVYEHTIALANRFMNHTHQLMHKATGWMLREMGKREPEMLIDYLDEHAKDMPRTALRYAIEKLEPEVRRHYMGR